MCEVLCYDCSRREIGQADCSEDGHRVLDDGFGNGNITPCSKFVPKKAIDAKEYIDYLEV